MFQELVTGLTFVPAFPNVSQMLYLWSVVLKPQLWRSGDVIIIIWSEPGSGLRNTRCTD